MSLPLSEADLQRIREVLRRGNAIHAIQIFRQITGVDLAEARDSVEAIRAGRFHLPASSVDSAADAASTPQPQENAMHFVREALTKGNKIGAVKRYRDLTRCSLTEAKNAVDALEVWMASMAREAESAPSFHAALYRGDKAEAMRLYRIKHGGSPGEARLAIDAMEAQMRVGSSAQSEGPSPSCLVRTFAILFIILVLVLAGIAIWQRLSRLSAE
jgi:ribosomal protein L7/L12